MRNYKYSELILIVVFCLFNTTILYSAKGIEENYSIKTSKWVAQFIVNNLKRLPLLDKKLTIIYGHSSSSSSSSLSEKINELDNMPLSIQKASFELRDYYNQILNIIFFNKDKYSKNLNEIEQNIHLKKLDILEKVNHYFNKNTLIKDILLTLPFDGVPIAKNIEDLIKRVLKEENLDSNSLLMRKNLFEVEDNIEQYKTKKEFVIYLLNRYKINPTNKGETLNDLAQKTIDELNKTVNTSDSSANFLFPKVIKIIKEEMKEGVLTQNSTNKKSNTPCQLTIEALGYNFCTAEKNKIIEYKLLYRVQLNELKKTKLDITVKIDEFVHYGPSDLINLPLKFIVPDMSLGGYKNLELYKPSNWSNIYPAYLQTINPQGIVQYQIITNKFAQSNVEYSSNNIHSYNLIKTEQLKLKAFHFLANKLFPQYNLKNIYYGGFMKPTLSIIPLGKSEQNLVEKDSKELVTTKAYAGSLIPLENRLKEDEPSLKSESIIVRLPIHDESLYTTPNLQYKVLLELKLKLLALSVIDSLPQVPIREYVNKIMEERIDAFIEELVEIRSDEIEKINKKVDTILETLNKTLYNVRDRIDDGDDHDRIRRDHRYKVGWLFTLLLQPLIVNLNLCSETDQINRLTELYKENTKYKQIKQLLDVEKNINQKIPLKFSVTYNYNKWIDYRVQFELLLLDHLLKRVWNKMNNRVDSFDKNVLNLILRLERENVAAIPTLQNASKLNIDKIEEGVKNYDGSESGSILERVELFKPVKDFLLKKIKTYDIEPAKNDVKISLEEEKNKIIAQTNKVIENTINSGLNIELYLKSCINLIERTLVNSGLDNSTSLGGKKICNIIMQELLQRVALFNSIIPKKPYSKSIKRGTNRTFLDEFYAINELKDYTNNLQLFINELYEAEKELIKNVKEKHDIVSNTEHSLNDTNETNNELIANTLQYLERTGQIESNIVVPLIKPEKCNLVKVKDLKLIERFVNGLEYYCPEVENTIKEIPLIEYLKNSINKMNDYVKKAYSYNEIVLKNEEKNNEFKKIIEMLTMNNEKKKKLVEGCNSDTTNAYNKIELIDKRISKTIEEMTKIIKEFKLDDKIVYQDTTDICVSIPRTGSIEYRINEYMKNRNEIVQGYIHNLKKWSIVSKIWMHNLVIDQIFKKQLSDVINGIEHFPHSLKVYMNKISTYVERENENIRYYVNGFEKDEGYYMEYTRYNTKYEFITSPDISHLLKAQEFSLGLQEEIKKLEVEEGIPIYNEFMEKLNRIGREYNTQMGCIFNLEVVAKHLKDILDLHKGETKLDETGLVVKTNKDLLVNKVNATVEEMDSFAESISKPLLGFIEKPEIYSIDTDVTEKNIVVDGKQLQKNKLLNTILLPYGPIYKECKNEPINPELYFAYDLLQYIIRGINETNKTSISKNEHKLMEHFNNWINKVKLNQKFKFRTCLTDTFFKMVNELEEQITKLDSKSLNDYVKKLQEGHKETDKMYTVFDKVFNILQTGEDKSIKLDTVVNLIKTNLLQDTVTKLIESNHSSLDVQTYKSNYKTHEDIIEVQELDTKILIIFKGSQPKVSVEKIEPVEYISNETEEDTTKLFDIKFNLEKIDIKEDEAILNGLQQTLKELNNYLIGGRTGSIVKVNNNTVKDFINSFWTNKMNDLKRKYYCSPYITQLAKSIVNRKNYNDYIVYEYQIQKTGLVKVDLGAIYDTMMIEVLSDSERLFEIKTMAEPELQKLEINQQIVDCVEQEIGRMKIIVTKRKDQLKKLNVTIPDEIIEEHKIKIDVIINDLKEGIEDTLKYSEINKVKAYIETIKEFVC
jgi:hypothetical protein